MRPIYVKRQNVTSAATATSGWLVTDQYVAPGNAIMSIKLTQKTAVTPTGTLTAVFTNDDIFDPSLNGAFANQVYTATPFNASGAWTITGFTVINSVVVVEATFDYVPRAVGTNLTITAGQVDFETQMIQLGIAST